MSKSFGEDALLLSGLICRHLGWRPPEFWAATPAEISAIFASAGDGDDPSISRSLIDKLMEQDQNG